MFKVRGTDVYKIEEVVTTTQTAISEVIYDKALHLKLSVDKTQIIANGTDTATIVASIFNYLDEPQATNGIEVIFSLGGLEEKVITSSGIASIPLTTFEIGEYIITANATDYRGNSVKVVAVNA